MSEIEFHQREIEWANGILAKPAYRMPNGRNSHTVANEVIDAAHDALIDHQCIRADGTICYDEAA